MSDNKQHPGDAPARFYRYDGVDEHWLEARKKGIGGSDIGAVLGLNPWKSAYALWAEKTGKVEPDDLSENEAVEFGQLLEPVVAAKYEKKTGRKLEMPALMEYRHPEHDWMRGTPDRFFHTEAGPVGVLEIKTAGHFSAKDWDDEPPVHYQAQGQWYAAILGANEISFAVLIGGQKFHWCDMARNERFIGFAMERGEQFWDCVKRDIPPSVDGSKATAEALARLYSAPDEALEPVILDFEFIERTERRRELKEQIKASEEEILGIDNQIKAALGNSTYGYLPDGSGWSYKKQHRNSYTVAASDYRVLRQIKAKARQ